MRESAESEWSADVGVRDGTQSDSLAESVMSLYVELEDVFVLQDVAAFDALAVVS